MRQGTVCSARGFAVLVLVCAGYALPVAAQQPAQQEKKEHVVRKGDTLWDLARYYLNDPYRWPLIYDANKKVVENPHWIYPAEKLIIPGMRPDTLLGTPVAVAAVAAVQGPNRSRFYVAGGDTAGQTLISSEMARIPLVQTQEWLAAPWIADSAALGVIAKVYKPYDPRDQKDKLIHNFHPRERLYITTYGPISPKDQLLVVRLTKKLPGLGWIVEPQGVLSVDSVSPGAGQARVISQFADLKVGDIAIPLPTAPAMPIGTLTEVSGGPNGRILDFLVEHPLYSNTDYAFVDLGASQGLAIGDELVAYLPARKPSKKHPEVLPEEPVARMQVIRTTNQTATVRVTHLNNTGLQLGLPVRVARKAP